MIQTKRKIRGYLSLCIAITILWWFKLDSSTLSVSPALVQGIWTDPSGNETWISVNAEGWKLRFAGMVFLTVTTDITWQDSHIGSDTIYDREHAIRLVDSWNEQGLSVSPNTRLPYRATDRFWSRSKLLVVSASVFIVACALLGFAVHQLYLAYIGDGKSCIRCGYDLTGMRGRRCPECGAKLERVA
ncbi:MAG: hypothetical protein KDA29_08940 [Phycisphaerales bacterium]|nr:hypothetical protein [Phycisphaerales bacterium]